MKSYNNNVISEESILLDIEASSKDEVFDIMSNNLYKLNRISSKEEFIKSLYEREALGETGVEMGLAIPHGKSKFVLINSLSVARLNNPIEWETLDDCLVSIVVMFAVYDGQNTNDEHLDLLAKVAGNLVEEDTIEFLKTSNDKIAIINKLLS
ncbi:PTS system, fructose specific enzyme II, A component [Brachyspira pilosicoli WesB]|uniref:PTS system, fructose specific enzyme II, A component n=1 Tax=Brachyspira pilosicoli WesB TaxID=1161918 RepID=K0JMN7_BRAPL|nr:fructose PTS transporter subunit IIA [Brachyspira pilosicoli]CCG57780.1 PTS system, fructose specific enzyme II, A component [Brachyspira pilosicoli WesB]